MEELPRVRDPHGPVDLGAVVVRVVLRHAEGGGIHDEIRQLLGDDLRAGSSAVRAVRLAVAHRVGVHHLAVLPHRHHVPADVDRGDARPVTNRERGPLVLGDPLLLAGLHASQRRVDRDLGAGLPVRLGAPLELIVGGPAPRSLLGRNRRDLHALLDIGPHLGRLDRGVERDHDGHPDAHRRLVRRHPIGRLDLRREGAERLLERARGTALPLPGRSKGVGRPWAEHIEQAPGAVRDLSAQLLALGVLDRHGVQGALLRRDGDGRVGPDILRALGDGCGQHDGRIGR